MKKDYYKLFGECFNNCDFSPFSRIIRNDCIYQSFDFLYILKGKERVVEELMQYTKQNVSADEKDKADIYKGFYLKSIFLLKTIKECCIVTRRYDNTNIRMLIFNKRWGKISTITGIEPNKVNLIRAQKIFEG